MRALDLVMCAFLVLVIAAAFLYGGTFIMLPMAARLGISAGIAVPLFLWMLLRKR